MIFFKILSSVEERIFHFVYKERVNFLTRISGRRNVPYSKELNLASSFLFYRAFRLGSTMFNLWANENRGC